jgi:hypothetical protein
MTQEPKDTHTELRRLVRMLEKTASMAEHASLTGSLAGGKEFAARSYNSVVEHLASIGEIPPGLFSSLTEDTNLDAVGIASAQLAEYLRAGLPEAETQGSAGQPGRILGDGNVFFNIGGLGDIGELVREHLPEWLRGKRGQPEPTENASEEQQSSEAPPPPGSAASARPGGGPPRVARLSLPTQQARIEELRPEPREQQTPQ